MIQAFNGIDFNHSYQDQSTLGQLSIRSLIASPSPPRTLVHADRVLHMAPIRAALNIIVGTFQLVARMNY